MKTKIENIDINYEIKGNGKAVIIIHGFYCDLRSMYRTIESVSSLHSGYKKIYVDLPGMGKSGSADWINSADIMLDILIKFIDKVIPEENFLLMGYSYGAYLARGIINKIATRVDGFLAVCPVIIADKSKRDVPEKEVLVKNEIIQKRLESENKVDFSSALVIQNKKNYLRFKWEIVSGIMCADRKFLRVYRENAYGFSFDVDYLVDKFDKPSLFIMGKYDSSVGYKDVMKIKDNYPNGSFEILDQAGHNLQIEQSKRFNELVNEWIKLIK